MNKKVIGLLIVIPLLLMLVLFTASTTVSLVTPIFVSNVVCENADVEYVNLSGDAEQLFTKFTVYPINADNKKVTYEFEPVEGKTLAEIEIKDDGRIVPKKCGTVKVVIKTVDNARTDSFILVVWSDKVVDYSLSLDKERYVVGEEFDVFAAFEPADAEDTELYFESADADVVSIDRYSGRARARSVGTTTVTATLQNGYNGKIVRSIEVAVVGSQSVSSISFSTKNLVTLSGTGEVLLSVDNAVGGEYVLDFLKTDADFSVFTSEKMGSDSYRVRFTLADGVTRTSVSARVKRAEFGPYESFEIIKADGVDSVEFYTAYADDTLNLKLNTQTIVRVAVSPEDAECSFEWSAEGSNAAIVANGNRCIVRGDSEGSSVLTVKVSSGGLLVRTLSLSVNVIEQRISNLNITTATPGIEKLLSVPKWVYSGDELAENAFSIMYGTEAVGDVSDDLEWSIAEGAEHATLSNGVLQVLSDGEITVSVKSKSAARLGRNVVSTMNYRVVDGVGVRTYDELMTAAAASKQIVLLNGIGSAKDVADHIATAEFGRRYSEILTTGDCQFYLNKDGIVPTVKVGVEFKNNVYGNGYVLNAHNLAYGLDATGTNLRSDAIFRGPLDFVMIDGAAVKGQDNIVYLVRDNVTIDNVELKGCDDVTKLEYLNYTGTTVEVIGDNVSIVNSRLSNGRTVLRVFGSDNVDDIVNVRVESCILRAAREFIIRVGCNKLVRGELNGTTGQTAYDNCSPKLGYGGKVYENTESQANYLNDADYAAEILRTRLIVKNCSLANCGIFTIGVDTHFAGPCLDGMPVSSGQNSFKDWDDCAATSYGVLLRLEGEVKMYDWKKISSVDSSTLIEGDVIKFDVSEIIQSVITQPEYASMSSLYNGEDYVHGGIAFFGGGRNYSVLDDRTGLTTGNNIKRYDIAISEAGGIGATLQMASGKEKFGFYMYAADGANTVAWQESELVSGTAFNWIKPANV